MSYLLAAVTFSVLCASSTLAQEAFYVAPGGDDRADGRSPDAAWGTIARVNRARLQPGDSVLFSRGGVFLEELRPPSSGVTGKPITFGAYGRGDRPVIDAGGPLNRWSDPAGWTEVSPRVWQCRIDRYPGRLWLSGREYGTSGDTTGRGARNPGPRYRWWSDGVRVLKVYAEDNPARAYSSVEAANQGRQAMTIRHKSWLVFTGLALRRGEVCIDVEDGDHLLFDSCAVLGGTSKYGLWLRGGSDSGEVRACLFDREDTVMHPFEFGGGPGHSNGQDNIALQWASGWDIHHSSIVGPGHDAVSVSGERAGEQIWRSCRNRIHHNVVTMEGDYGRFTSTNGRDDPSFCAGNEFYCNVVRGMSVQSQFMGRDNYVHDNLFTGFRKVPYEPLHYHSCVIDLSDYFTPAGDRIRIEHNTFADCDANAISVRPGTRRASIRNNLIVNTGRLTGVGGRDFLDHVGILFWPGAATDTVADNVIWCAGRDPIVYLEPAWDRNTKRSTAWFNAQDGKSGNAISGNVSLDPRLDSAYKPRAPLPVKQAGRREDACR